MEETPLMALALKFTLRKKYEHDHSLLSPNSSGPFTNTLSIWILFKFSNYLQIGEKGHISQRQAFNTNRHTALDQKDNLSLVLQWQASQQWRRWSLIFSWETLGTGVGTATYWDSITCQVFYINCLIFNLPSAGAYIISSFQIRKRSFKNLSKLTKIVYLENGRPR